MKKKEKKGKIRSEIKTKNKYPFFLNNKKKKKKNEKKYQKKKKKKKTQKGNLQKSIFV